MILLGYAAMLLLGLLPLAGLARLTGTDAQEMFYFSTPYALAIAAVIGVVSCVALGRILGLLSLEGIGSYEHRRAMEAEQAALRRRRATTARVRVRAAAGTALMRV